MWQEEFPADRSQQSHIGMEKAASELMDRMRQVGHAIAKTTTVTEGEFLSICLALRDFDNRARTISEMSLDVVTQMTGTRIGSAIESLKGLLEKMEAYLRRSENDIEMIVKTLWEVLQHTGVAHELLREFHGFTKALRTTIVTAKVYNSALITENEEIKLLLQEVNKFSEIVETESYRVQSNLKSLKQSIDRVLSELLIFRENQQSRTRVALHHAAVVHSSMMGQCGLATNIAKSVSDRTTKISQSIGEIVKAVQFHDITCQQFEQMRAAFSSLWVTLTGASASPSFDYGDKTSGFAVALADFCRNQLAQLIRIRNTFVAAVKEIIDNLLHITASVAHISGDMQRIAGNNKVIECTFLTEMEGMLYSVEASFAALEENAEARRELADTFLSLFSRTKELSEFVGYIKEIAGEIEIIAFNAEIKSFRVGTKGDAFKVVAMRLRHLCSKVSVHTKEISEVLTVIASAMAELSSSINAELERMHTEIDDISGSLGGMIHGLNDLNNVILSLCKGIEESSQRLSKDIKGITEKMTVHIVIDRIVNEVVDRLKDIVSKARLMLPAGDDCSWNWPMIRWSSEISGAAIASAHSQISVRPDDAGHDIEFF